MSNLIPSSGAIQSQADSDRQLIQLWLHGKSPVTQSAYSAEVRRFESFVNKPLSQVRLSDLTAYLETRAHQSPATQSRAANVLKSLFSFAVSLGYLQFNPAKPVMPPKVKNTLAERILSEEQVVAIARAETCPRRRAMLLLFYGGALRVSELCGLQWRDLQPRGNSGQVTVFGKGGKTGVVLLPDWAWAALMAIAPESPTPDAFVFPGETGQGLHRVTAWRWVKAAAQRAGIEASCHWFRHSHASHALERGATLALIQQTLRHSSVATTSKYLHVRPNESSGGFLSL